VFHVEQGERPQSQGTTEEKKEEIIEKFLLFSSVVSWLCGFP
jgi:hypothetical protein